MAYLVWALVVLLLVLHQDNWNWNNPKLVFGFVPIGLLYHVAISLAAAAVWYLATLFAWPAELAEEPAAPGEPQAAEGER